ncbi:MAG: universal stress protein [Clostridiaceae bacterium]|nr:universal stress protein [Clostridiaceae bacterium]
MNDIFKTISPEDDLEITNKKATGNLKIFLGYAPGVGKTYSMLNEANRRSNRGQDVIIGYLETHGRAETEGQVSTLETIPRKKIQYNGVNLEEMNTEAIIARNPSVVLVDELAHTNITGSANKKRYEDVQELLDHGINVISTLNIQHLESLNDVIKQITGVTVIETIPDKIVDNAAEIVVVDITPDALQSRLKRGNVYKPENIDRALKNFFRKGNLNALREIALRQTAEGVDEDLEEYMKEHGIKDNWYTVERVLVCISASPSAKKLIRRGARIAKRNKCEWTVTDVNCTHFSAPKLTKKDFELLQSHYKLAKQLGADIETLSGKSVSQELARFAEKKHITQIIIGHSRRTVLQTFLRGSTVSKLLMLLKDVEIHVIPNDLP